VARSGPLLSAGSSRSFALPVACSTAVGATPSGRCPPSYPVFAERRPSRTSILVPRSQWRITGIRQGGKVGVTSGMFRWHLAFALGPFGAAQAFPGPWARHARDSQGAYRPPSLPGPRASAGGRGVMAPAAGGGRCDAVGRTAVTCESQVGRVLFCRSCFCVDSRRGGARSASCLGVLNRSRGAVEFRRRCRLR